MKTKTFLSVLTVGLFLSAFSQKATIDLTFTAVDSAAYIQLDSIKIMNRTQGGDTVLYWPDTVLSINYVGIHENSDLTSELKLFQNYPNPVTDQTTVLLYVPEKDKVTISVTDILGRIIVKSERMLDKGKHSFRFTPGSENLYLFSAIWRGEHSSINILQTNSISANTAALEYIGYENSSAPMKANSDIQSFFFTIGDQLLRIGYYDTLQSGMLSAPESNETFIFQFATNIPCPGTPTVQYEGQTYNTIQIFSQCWLKENLNVGTMIQGEYEMTNNGIIEKYCYDNESDSCTKYGGLYQWNEMMQYTTQQGAQGICPPGWHLPTDEEWKVLEGAVDSQYRIGDLEWDDGGIRGYDAGTNLKTTSGWYENGNGTDLFGFSGLPGGDRSWGGLFGGVSGYGNWWTSTEDGNGVWSRGLNYYNPVVDRYDLDEALGNIVRCLSD